ncbi:hypothetical protein L195_g000433 [Trifolium pratense]|uniref:TF-B3 domain-containing protein n=1 Tax=Trifolium pratense TaxID=57577 RepID=A0A2K3NLV9_TRIPR|nr:hypothetical protein L195_g000433 [Trifolium pratense]
MATQYDDGGVTVAFHGREDKQNKAAENKYKLLNSPTTQGPHDETQSPKFGSSNKVTTDGTLSRGEAISSAVIQAEGLKSNLKPEFPSFVKSLVRSHVASCFWMGLPVAFCKRHLPDKDTTITLEDESGREYKTKYIACKNIIDTDVACNSPKRKNGKHVPQDMQKKKKIVAPKMETKTKQFTEQFENDSDEAFSEIFEGFKMPEFKDVKGFQNFSIIVDGMPIDDELSTEVRNKYYKLCYSQQAFLHENLIRGLNYMLIVGIISEIVNIADAIKVSVISTPRFEFSNWDKALHAFEKLGMNVEFLRVRLRRLVSIAYEMDNAPETRRYLAYRTEDHSRAENEIKNMEIKLEELKEACSGFGDYLESLKHKAERYEHKFQQEVAASW